jgi:hypothetical protein
MTLPGLPVGFGAGGRRRRSSNLVRRNRTDAIRRDRTFDVKTYNFGAITAP